jgi:hypothetical protein
MQSGWNHNIQNKTLTLLKRWIYDWMDIRLEWGVQSSFIGNRSSDMIGALMRPRDLAVVKRQGKLRMEKGITSRPQECGEVRFKTTGFTRLPYPTTLTGSSLQPWYLHPSWPMLFKYSITLRVSWMSSVIPQTFSHGRAQLNSLDRE